MEWGSAAEEYMGAHGWGARGKRIGVSRMFSDADKNLVARHKLYASLRPRGILSGFLAVPPRLGYAVYIPPIAPKSGGMQRIRMRLSEELVRDGALFSVYLTKEREFVIEDILVWRGESVWNTDTFEKRWERMADFLTNNWRPDKDIQECNIRIGTYISLSELQEPTDSQVVEFVPSAAGMKRLIWIPSRDSIAPAPVHVAPAGSQLLAKRETALGPDVYSVWRGEERLGLALVRTLAISKALRLHTNSEIPIAAQWNKQFEKWEVQIVDPRV